MYKWGRTCKIVMYEETFKVHDATTHCIIHVANDVNNTFYLKTKTMLCSWDALKTTPCRRNKGRKIELNLSAMPRCLWRYDHMALYKLADYYITTLWNCAYATVAGSDLHCGLQQNEVRRTTRQLWVAVSVALESWWVHQLPCRAPTHADTAEWLPSATIHAQLIDMLIWEVIQSRQNKFIFKIITLYTITDYENQLRSDHLVICWYI